MPASPPSDDTWRPSQYDRFREERRQPFHDLLALVAPVPGGRAVDLGCGTGAPTRVLHERLGLASTVGVDRSAAMLAGGADDTVPGLRFVRGDLDSFDPGQRMDLVFSNAALHWLPDHEALFPRLGAMLAPGGQLAVQMPANHDHPSHAVAHAVAREEPFRTALHGYVREVSVLAPERYALLLDRLGAPTPHVRLQVYLHRLASRDEIVEWVRGTLLTDYESRMPPDLFARYLDRYRAELLPRLDDVRPYPYAFKRLLLHARVP